MASYDTTHDPLALKVTNDPVELMFSVSDQAETSIDGNSGIANKEVIVRRLSGGEWGYDNLGNRVNLNQEGSFTVAGSYTVELWIVDKAGNRVSSGEKFLDFVPGDLDPGSIALAVNGNANNGNTCDIAAGLKADRTDYCELELSLEDEFGNPLFGDLPTCDHITFNNDPISTDPEKETICLAAHLSEAPDSDGPASSTNFLFKVSRSGTVQVSDQNINETGTMLGGSRASGVYNVIDDAQAAFRNGIRFTDGDSGEATIDGGEYQYAFENSMIDGHVRFKVVGLVPSGTVVDGGKVNDYLFVPGNGTALEFNIRIENINWKGERLNSYRDVTLSAPAIGFVPALKAELKNHAQNDQTLTYQNGEEDQWDLLIGAVQDIWGRIENVATVYTGGNQFVPTDKKIAFRGHAPHLPQDDYDFSFERKDLENDGGGDGAIEDIFGEEDHTTTTLRPQSEEYEAPLVAFTSKLEYQVTDPIGGTKTVIYPGRNLGNTVGIEGASNIVKLFDCADLGPHICDNTKIKGLTIGADIEGQILTAGGNFTYEKGKSNLLEMGDVRIRDVREDITRRAYELARGRAAETNTNFDVTNFEDGGVTYYKDQLVRIGTAGTVKTLTGTHTIVIKDGNLVIQGDLVYAGGSGSFGVILINSEVGANTLADDSVRSENDNGNIFVHKDVQYFVGTYFADGGIISTNKALTTNPVITIAEEITKDVNYRANHQEGSPWEKQLILEGTLLTKNTLGGATGLRGTEGGMVNPWGKEASRVIAQRYDLNFVRRYSPPGEGETRINYCTPQDPKRELSITNPCDNNKHSFVVRVDGRAQHNPPPGFRVGGR